MAGDLKIEQRAVVLPNAELADINEVAGIAHDAGSGLIHQFGPSVLITETSPEIEKALNEEFPGIIIAARLVDVPLRRLAQLDPGGLHGLKMLDLKQTLTNDLSAREEAFTPSDCLRDSDVSKRSLDAAGGNVSDGTSTRLTGRVAIALIFVNGPFLDLRFTDQEVSEAAAKATAGMELLTYQKKVRLKSDAPIKVEISVPADPTAPELEAVWLKPVMNNLNFPGTFDGVKDFVKKLRMDSAADWAFCAFFTKYPTRSGPTIDKSDAYAYLDGPYMVIKYAKNATQFAGLSFTFAHEMAHIFGANDEYVSSFQQCKCTDRSGYFNILNGNCVSCAAGGGVDCMMRSTGNPNLCQYSLWQIGFAGAFPNLYLQGEPGNGIGHYDLKSPADRGFALDFNSRGRLDHLVFYRPGRGAIFIIRNANGTFSAPVSNGEPGPGIGGYDLASPADRGFAYDGDSSGNLDHLVFYRPGTGAIYILKRSADGVAYLPIYHQDDPGAGIGEFDLSSPADRAFAYDFDHSGKRDHIVLYRPGTGFVVIVKHNGGGIFSTVFKSTTGLGDFKLDSPLDRGFAYDFDSSGKLDCMVFYRPGEGDIFMIAHKGKVFGVVVDGDGIGSFDLLSPSDGANGT